MDRDHAHKNFFDIILSKVFEIYSNCPFYCFLYDHKKILFFFNFAESIKKKVLDVMRFREP